MSEFCLKCGSYARVGVATFSLQVLQFFCRFFQLLLFFGVSHSILLLSLDRGDRRLNALHTIGLVRATDTPPLLAISGGIS